MHFRAVTRMYVLESVSSPTNVLFADACCCNVPEWLTTRSFDFGQSIMQSTEFLIPFAITMPKWRSPTVSEVVLPVRKAR